MALCGSDGKAVVIELSSLPTIIYIYNNGYFAYKILASLTARVRICLKKAKTIAKDKTFEIQAL